MKKLLLTIVASLGFLGFGLSTSALAADYEIDVEGAHASVNFKIQHLGYSWLTGRFDDFSGSFKYDENDISASSISVTLDVASLNSNHEKRDNHLRSADYLDAEKFPTATFVSTEISDLGNSQIEVVGDLTLHGVTKSIVILSEKIGEGKDPWGGYRAGFSGETILSLADFGIKGSTVILELHIEGIQKK